MKSSRHGKSPQENMMFFNNLALMSPFCSLSSWPFEMLELLSHTFRISKSGSYYQHQAQCQRKLQLKAHSAKDRIIQKSLN